MDESRYKRVELACEICERDDFVQILDKGRVGRSGEYGPVSIRQCRHCGHVMMNPRYEAQYYIDYYREHYKDNVSNFGGENPDQEFLDERVIARGTRIQQHLENVYGLKNLSMLDLGCGYGATMVSFRDAGWKVQGIDPELSCVKFGREQLGMPVDEGYAEDLPYETGIFELVLSLGALEHVHDFPKAMTEINRVLRPDGYLFIRMRHNRFWGLIWEYFNKNHYRFFNGATHKLAGLRYGFKTIDYTDEQIESRTGDRYLLCKKIGEPSLERAEKAIATGLRDTPEALNNFLDQHHKSFIDRANDLLALETQCGGDHKEMARRITSGEFEYTLLFGDPVESIERALLEARRGLTESGLEYPGLSHDET